MSNVATASAPERLVLPSGAQAAMSIDEYTCGLDIVAFATNGVIDTERPDTVVDCVATNSPDPARIALCGIFNIKRVRQSEVADTAMRIRTDGVKNRINIMQEQVGKIDRSRSSDVVKALQAARYSLKVLFIGSVFRVFNPNDPEYSDRLFTAIEMYRDTIFDSEARHPALVLARKHYQMGDTDQ